MTIHSPRIGKTKLSNSFMFIVLRVCRKIYFFILHFINENGLADVMSARPFCFYAGRLFFLTSVPGTLTLRASCLTLRLCLRIPLDGRLVLACVFAGVEFT